MKKIFVVLGLLTLISACVATGVSQPSRFYSLQSINLQNYSNNKIRGNVGVMEIALADYLDKPQIVTLKANQIELDVSEKNRWSESLSTMIQRVMADDLAYYHVGQNIGFGRGHNYILDKINSDYHAIVNPDILLTEDSFSKILDFMDRDSTIGMVIPKMVDQNGDMLYVCRRELTKWDMFIRMVGRKVFKKRIAYHEMRDMDYTKPFDVPFGQGSFLVIRTQLLKELNGFDDNFFMYVEDADLCKRVNQVSKLMYYPGTTVIHKWEKGSHKKLKLFKYHLNSMRYYFKKWKQQKSRV